MFHDVLQHATLENTLDLSSAFWSAEIVQFMEGPLTQT